MPYKTVGLIGKPAHSGTHDSLNALVKELTARQCKILIEQRIEDEILDKSLQVCSLDEIGQACDLAIVVGGDGYMLGAARVLAKHQIDVVGVNRGNLGFLTDISPEDIARQLALLFDGQGHREARFVLETSVFRNGSLQSADAAVNEVVLHHTKVAHMMEFELYIDKQFVFSQRSDGLIVATPTGSTAYSLSGGGPILMPQLNALTLVPMFPHTLSSRPIVVDADSEITLRVSKANTQNLQVSCDSHIVITLEPGDEVVIRKNPDKLNLIHPPDYNYFNVLRTKLGWGSKLY
ncbi:NAD(+) kinase [Glaciecola sp. KUL10]|jgi:NAD+ kinase|uniref:NAD(+) kinase n=1 Tax=Glaciecola sp. (strain KUL10) TaxID=2161813 RepID=UPI000D788B37|nr:NAD(+) kinase [Glaciecola sp. KUL10]GBL03407.1 NAD(+) kinase [Glaciecola sp. KUL10]